MCRDQLIIRNCFRDHGPQHQVNPPQLRHPQGQIPPPGYQPPHQQHLAPPFPGPSNPNLNSSSEESPKKPIMERIKGLVPAPTHLDNSGLDEMNVIQLCNVGREVTNEISIRFLNLFSCLRMPADRKTAPATDVEAIVTYIRHLTIKLVELRARIDRQRLNDKKWTDDDFFDYLTTEDDENAKQLTEKKAVMERVEENRVDIINKSNQIKKLEWLTAVMDPRHKK